ncbi:hypothetical protein BLNAU_7455 [Blattamonas nauphoetae]|uniref:Uncharacterized protein n=1 Tax=Blattamonas nauphoetae TaxID=2049346 RepID=A0ABQ9Y1D8_9EUKA|nr:hypothetical protein BLNAU_7455 [Blattamonas nauphoetae]
MSRSIVATLSFSIAATLALLVYGRQCVDGWVVAMDTYDIVAFTFCMHRRLLTTHTLPLPSASPSPPTPSHSPLPLPHHPHPPTPLCLSSYYTRRLRISLSRLILSTFPICPQIVPRHTTSPALHDALVTWLNIALIVLVVVHTTQQLAELTNEKKGH